MKTRLIAAALVGSLSAAATVALAGEIGHDAPGVANIRDFNVPDPGFCCVVYNYWCSTDRLNDRNGNKVSSVTVEPGGDVTLGVDVNVDVYAVPPTNNVQDVDLVSLSIAERNSLWSRAGEIVSREPG